MKERKKLKKIKCYNCERDFFGSIYLSKISGCPDCKKKGFIRKIQTKKIKCYNCEKYFEGSDKLPNLISACPECKEKGFSRNYSKEKKESIILKFKKTMLKNHNVEIPLKSKIILEKFKQSKNKNKIKQIKCYNCGEFFLGSVCLPNLISPCPECKEKGFGRNYSEEKRKSITLKSKKTMLKNYNVENPMESKIILEKSKLTRLNNINKTKKVKCYNCNEIFLTSIYFKKTTPCPACKEKGFRSKRKIVKYSKEKIEQTNSKRIKTYLKNFNVDNPLKSKEIQEKYNKTMLKNHNVKWSMESKKIYEKHKQTMLVNFNTYNYKLSKEYQIKVFENIKKKLEILELEFVDKEYKGFSFIHSWKCLKCNNIFQHSWINMYKCPTCYPREIRISIGELEIFEFIKSLNILKNNENLNIESSNRKIIKPLELDIYIPDKKIAIEFNGLWWHSEEYKSQTYHMDKTQKCIKSNIQLIHIFEVEWMFKQEIVKSRLKQIIGGNNQKRIHARKCIIKEITPKRKNEFLEKFHIQGPDSSTIKLGAFYNEDLISVMTFSKGNISKGSKSIKGIWELNRFCSDSNFQIPGIAGKLLSHFKKNYVWKEIFSYADRRWSQGNLYYKLGFELIHITGPNYWYIKNFRRIHRFSLRKREDEPKEITERILRLNEGYGIIWDCGSLKFRMLNKKENY